MMKFFLICIGICSSALGMAQTKDSRLLAVPHTKLSVSATMPAVAQLQIFAVKNEDESLSLALRRWAHEHRYRLVWDAGKDFPVKETTYQAVGLIAAIEQVMDDTEQSSYPLHACAYRNRVVRVLHISQPCVRR